jgi:hypothetical protein
VVAVVVRVAVTVGVAVAVGVGVALGESVGVALEVGVGFGTALATRTEMLKLPRRFPFAPYAFAEMVWAPFGTLVESHVIVAGGVVA